MELKYWQEKKEKCCHLKEKYMLLIYGTPMRGAMCSPCLAAVGGSKEPCISLTGAGTLFNQMTEEQMGNIGRLFAQVFKDSVCNVTKSDLGEELWNLTPPWGV